MTESICTYQGDREGSLIAYLYDDIEPAERAAFEAHLARCPLCRGELDALGAVRAQLSRWAPPEPVLSPRDRSRGSRWTAWRGLPAWAQVAAAMLLVGVSLGAANLDVRYDRNGLSVRTGWLRPAPATISTSIGPAAAPWRSDLTALGQQLRNEFQGSQRAASATVPSAQSGPSAVSMSPKSAASDAGLMRRVKALLDESERQQQRELALRVAEVVHDVNSQRQADLRKIDMNIGLVQNATGAEVLRQREMLNYLVQRVSQRQ
jgi:hypothetical protein